MNVEKFYTLTVTSDELDIIVDGLGELLDNGTETDNSVVSDLYYTLVDAE